MSSRSKKQRPVSTAAISLPQVQDASTLTSLSQFSPDAALFALLSLAVDKHRLRVFDATTGSALVEHTVDAARVTSLSWISLDLTSDGTHKDASPTKKRKKTASRVASNAAPTKTQLICLGLSNGSLALFSPSHARVLRTLSHPSSLASVLATSGASQPSHVWSSSSDGAVRLWNAARNELLGAWTGEGSIPYSSLAPRPGQDEEVETELLVANHAMRLVSLPHPTSSTSDPVKLMGGTSFTGHASAITCLQWDSMQTSRFVSVAEMDRVINVWHVPDPPSKQGTVVANIPLDAAARHAAFSPVNDSTLLTISVSGKLALFELPSPSKSSSKVATPSPSSTIYKSSKKDDEVVHIVAAAFVPQEKGRLRVAHLMGGVKPVFEVVHYLDDAGEFIKQVSLSKDLSSGLVTAAGKGPSTAQKRYIEGPTLAVQSGFEPDQDRDLDDIPSKGVDGDLDVDLAELSLGQRLTALSGGDLDLTNADMSSFSENDVASSSKRSTSRRKRKSRKGKEGDSDHLAVPAHSLSRTLVQALHSADTRLLETCLLHSDEVLVMNTVRRLPPQLAVPLLTACVERLGRGARANTAKGGGGGASAQRGTGLVRWIRAVLIVHTAHLMTIPDLVTRLSGLYATLTARLALRDPLLSLSGRLELVLSQIELRSSAGPTIIAPESRKSGQKEDKRTPLKYVEGESDSQDEEGEGEDEMEIEKDDGTGSIEDVELGADSASDAEDESGGEDEEMDSENEESDEGPHLNGFIDDQAEEWSEEEDEDLED